MSSLNNKIGASMYYLCATSTMFALVVMVVGAIAPATLATDIELVPATSTGMHNLIASQATEAVTVTEASATNEADDDKSNNLNNKIQKNNRIGSAMVLLPSMSSSASDNGHLASNSSSMRQHHKNDRYQQESHSNDNANEDRMEQSEGYLHLDEHNFVATTPKIQTTKLPNRYEQGLEDYEEAVARVDKLKEEQLRQQQSFGWRGLETALSFIETASNVWNKVSSESSRSHKASAPNEQSTMTETMLFDRQTTNDFATDINDTSATDIGEARYIKGDPLKGYYDFIITEGSYKFWAGFQLFTAGLMIYSTFAAIYYSKVNPVVGDYDYTSYLGGARSMADDPEPLATSSSSPLSELADSYLFQTAAHGFQFVLDAIEKIPQT